jgi:eukaryotic-like serine/threonine-protein kinase
MTLSAGTRLGPYEIVGPLGAGGMGEVYRARDTKLGRDVALKLLPDLLADDPDRLARFEREAKTLAALNHPHIAHIYGLDQSNSVQALVLELVEGPTLADRIAHGPIPVDEALPIARQIADALEAAHDQGIIHRDLKPANVKVRPDGVVKVLDFGLAKALVEESSGPHAFTSPTITSPAVLTRAGVILGTAAYMSPEQVRGKPVDKRADIWAFGCVVYEMLTGRRLFARDTVTDTLAAVLHDEPSLDALPADTPERVRVLLRRCLERDQRQRLRDIGEARIAFSDAQSGAAATGGRVGATGHATQWWRRSVLFALPVATIVAVVIGFSRRERAPAPIMRFDVLLPDGDRLDTRVTTVISPDGRWLVYRAFRNDRPQLFLRAIGDPEPRALPGTFDAEEPFFSPDGQWVGFLASGNLQKSAVAGGSPIVLCPAESAYGGATWASDGTIVFTTTAGLLRIPASGGTPQPVTMTRGDQRNERIGWPQVLPGGRAILFGTVRNDITSFDDARIEVLSLTTGDRKTLIERGHDPRYIPTGHLLFARSGDVFALPFDASRLEVVGDPIRILTGVAGATFASAQFSVSDNGSLAFVSGPPDLNDTTLVLVDRHGTPEAIGAPPRRYVHPRVSPDGRRVLVETRATSSIRCGCTISSAGRSPA